LRGRSISPRWDLWALAVIAYEALCGCVPFAGDDLAMLESAIMGVNFPPVAGVMPEAPPSWQAFFERTFTHAEEKRADSAAMFWKQLRECLEPGA
jgi:serine/threonine protein kinase